MDLPERGLALLALAAAALAKTIFYCGKYTYRSQLPPPEASSR